MKKSHYSQAQIVAILKVGFFVSPVDAIVVKIRMDKQVINKAIHLALGIHLEGEKELLGMWCHVT